MRKTFETVCAYCGKKLIRCESSKYYNKKKLCRPCIMKFYKENPLELDIIPENYADDFLETCNKYQLKEWADKLNGLLRWEEIKLKVNKYLERLE